MKLKSFLNYLYSVALYAIVLLVKKIFAALSKKCSAIVNKAERLQTRSRKKTV